MIVDRSLLEEYPCRGKFFNYGVINPDAPLKDQEEGEILVLETECDIQQISNSDASGFIRSSFNVFFPFDKTKYSKKKPFPIKRGTRFEGWLYGLSVEGTVSGVFPTQMGGCECTLEDVNV